MHKLGITTFTIALVLLVAALVATHAKRSLLCAENLALQAQIQRLLEVAERSHPAALTAGSSESLSEEQRRELLRLRGSIGVLRRQTNEIARLRVQNQQLRAEVVEPAAPMEYLRKGSWNYVGYADPESALQSTFWAQASGDRKAIVASMHPGDRAAVSNRLDEAAALLARNKTPAFRILGRKRISDDEVVLIVHCYPDRSDVANGEFTFRRTGTEWRFYIGWDQVGGPWWADEK